MGPEAKKLQYYQLLELIKRYNIVSTQKVNKGMMDTNHIVIENV